MTILFSTILFSTSVLAIQTSDAERDHWVVEGLTKRRLFDLAETACRHELKNQTAGSVGQAEWTIELIKVLSARALTADVSDRESAWKNCDDASKQFLDYFPSHPHHVLVEIQSALSRLARAQLMGQEIQIELRSIADAEQAIEILQSASRQFQAIDRKIKTLVPSAPLEPRESGELTQQELQNLKTNVAVQLSRCNVDRALLLPASRRNDRLDILRRANIELDNVLRSTSPDQPLWWEVQVDAAKIKRLQNDLAGSNQMLQRLKLTEAPESVLPKIEEERTRLMLAVGNVEVLQKAIQDSRNRFRSPSHDLLRLEVALRIAGGLKAEQAKTWQQQALIMTKQIEDQHGAYWARRASLLLTKTLGGESAQPSDAQILLRVASEAERKSQWQAAIEAYDKAAGAFQTSNQPAQEFKVRYRTALILQQLKRYTEAQVRFEKIAESFPNESEAAQASLLAIWNYAQTIDNKPEELSEYLAMLNEHLERWMAHESAGQALIWRARLSANRGEYVKALEDLLQVQTDNKVFDDAIRLTGQWIDRAFTEVSKSNQSERDYALELTGQLESKLSDEPDQIPQVWTPTTRELALLLGRINLTYFDEDAKPVERLLNAAWESSTEHDRAWRSQAAAWMVVALALQDDKRDQLQFRLQQINEPDSWSQLMAGLNAVSARVNDSSKKQLLAETQLLVSRSLEKQLDRLDVKQKIKWTIAKALALETSGQRDQAVVELEKLAKSNAKNSSVQVAYAEVLTRSERKSDWETALGRWRLIAAATKSNSAVWFQAKYHVALLLEKTDKKVEAAKFLNYLKAVPPGWNDSQLKSKFDELMRRVQ